MIFWIDAQLSPALAPWIAEEFGIESYSVQRLGYRDAADHEIFFAARKSGAVVITKDKDFTYLIDKHGPPPQVLWVTLGNTSNNHMRTVLKKVLPEAVALFEQGEPLVEIG
ncbi:DUF5615 family PIN-like protein [Microbulbifer rhizosphaerae]|uniref:Putative nuclease of putative toxin-antitoxin system n=1 Tax=Microbulbifer rhizosphaerae TaxID=1562603 RepID=A0A7W4WEE4_9GAMM|nr:DUF5615 family PIN-like protein [Microbulbifer rhizosphaerae]MBB3062671.1 putative nuclease of putative toxin-antitoxin system [Microbulbifer rhizosphaerae]